MTFKKDQSFHALQDSITWKTYVGPAYKGGQPTKKAGYSECIWSADSDGETTGKTIKVDANTYYCL